MSRILAITATTVATALLLHGCAGSSATTGTHNARKSEATAISAGPLDESEPNKKQHAAPRTEEDDIYFSLGSTEVDEAGKKKLRAHALRLQQDPKLIVTLTGLTDDSGSRSYNLLVAEKRTAAVAELLRTYGVARSQIRLYALGNRKPDAPCKTLVCRQKMRRVELNYPSDPESVPAR